MITLNSQQKAAIEKIIDPEVQGFTLWGEGGTGKTTCIMEAVKFWIESGAKVLLSAPTNKAVKQLQFAANNAGLNVDCMTASKALGLALLPTSERKHVARMGKGVMDYYNVVVFDESSMISKVALNDYIMPEVCKNNMKVVFMGDEMQLPPVGERKSEALHVYPGEGLTKVERFKEDSGIAKSTTALRKTIQSNKQTQINFEEFGVERILQANFDKEICKLFENSTTDDTRVLAWTNARTNEINEKVRTTIYGKGANKFEIGEKVVIGSPIFNEFGEVELTTDEEATVTAMTESSVTSHESGISYPVWVVAVTPESNQNTTVFCQVLKDEAISDLEDELNEFREKAKKTGQAYYWKKLHSVKELFADLKYCYCITIHRSQGSTFKTVAVDVNNIFRNRDPQERKKLLYVAISRASERLLVNQGKVIL